ncbi:MAG: LCP family protein, partial [Chloroflexales bacterium]|nr:LCP family protein [Chloroflexales bacterium]
RAGAPTPTAISLPSISGAAPLPTLMPTIGVAPVGDEAINILLLGSDRRPGESWQTRSDAIMVLRLEPARQRVALLSFPRDLLVNIPGVGYSRINSATVYGDMYPDLGGGLELARATVSDLTGLPIHHVARADFNAFITAIDAIGGIDLVVESELYDPEYPTMDYGYTVAHFLPGPQHLDGQTALMYARLRHADSDYYRARRQQQVIQAIMQRVREQNVLGQVQMLADLSSALRDDIQTDLSLEQMLGVAWAFRNFSPDLVERYTLDENLTSVGAAGDPYAITAAPGAIQLVVGQLLNGAGAAGAP